MSELKSLIDLCKQVQEQEKLVKYILQRIIEDVAKSQHRAKISKHIFILRFSEITGYPWNPEFYDWEASGKILMKKIADKNPIDSISYIESLYQNRKKNICYIIYKKHYRGCGMYETLKIPIQSSFIAKILERIQETL